MENAWPIKNKHTKDGIKWCGHVKLAAASAIEGLT